MQAYVKAQAKAKEEAEAAAAATALEEAPASSPTGMTEESRHTGGDKSQAAGSEEVELRVDVVQVDSSPADGGQQGAGRR